MLGQQGARDNTLEMENTRGRKYLPRFAKPRRIHYGLPTENGKPPGRKGGNCKPERCKSSGPNDGIVFQSSFVWVRQTGADKFERQTVGSCRN